MNKKHGVILSVFLLVTLFVSLPKVSANYPSGSPPYTTIYRPFPTSYSEGSVTIQNDTFTEAYSQQWNFANWNVTELNMTVQFSGDIGGDGGYRPGGIMAVWISQDNGTSWANEFNCTIPPYTLNSSYADWGARKCVQFTYNITDYADLFYPRTLMKWTVHNYTNPYYPSVAFQTGPQNYPPNYHFIDGSDNYVQYYTLFTVTYDILDVPYTASTLTVNSTIDAANLDLLYQALVNHMMYETGAMNDYNSTYAFGSQDTASIHPTYCDIAARSMLRLSQYNETIRQELLDMFLRYTAWAHAYLFEVEGEDAGVSNPYLVRFANHLINQSQMIDTSAALRISNIADYHKLTGDNDTVDLYWDDLQECYDFLVSLNVTSGDAEGLNVNGWYQAGQYYYPANGTELWERSYYMFLQDVIEAYEGVVDMEYLANLKGNATLEAECNSWASLMYDQMNSVFWNSTLNRQTIGYNISSAKQDTTMGYGVISLGMYHLSENSTRLYNSIVSYLNDWIIDLGDYPEIYYPLDYDYQVYGGFQMYSSAANLYHNTEGHATMVNMLICALDELRDQGTTLNQHFGGAISYLYYNDFYNGTLLDNRGYLAWTNEPLGTYAESWERIITSVAWGVEAILDYEITDVDVTFTQSPGGTIYPNGTVACPLYAQVLIWNFPDDGYYFVRWFTSGNVTAYTYSLYVYGEGGTVEAYFSISAIHQFDDIVDELWKGIYFVLGVFLIVFGLALSIFATNLWPISMLLFIAGFIIQVTLFPYWWIIIPVILEVVVFGLFLASKKGGTKSK